MNIYKVPFDFAHEEKYDGDNKKVTVENTPVDIEVTVDKNVDKEEAQGNEIVTYDIDNIKNLSNVKLEDFTLTDNLPEDRIQSLQTGTYNEDLQYEIQYITNKNTNWKNIGEKYNTTENYTIDLTSETLGLEDGEYVEEFRLVFGKVKSGFEATITPIVKAKVNEDVQNNKIFVNNTYVTADYQETELKAEDEAHTIVYTKTPETEKELPKTGM